MEYPVLHIGWLGDGMTIALDAVTHVIISHGVAIGMMTVLVLFQTMFMLKKDNFWNAPSKALLKPIVITTTSVGAMTGVGIWFITAALAPEGIGSLIHLFFWPWFIEWIAFTTEVIIIIVYFKMWNKLVEKSPAMLALLGWLYVITAMISAVLISGILGFMLTPDGWPEGQTFMQAYFNPTFIPQFTMRIAAGIVIGSILIIGWISWRFKGEKQERSTLLRVTGATLILSMAVTAIFAYIYFSRIPDTFLTHWKFAVATSALSENPEILYAVNAIAFTAIFLCGLFAFMKRRFYAALIFIPAILFSIFTVAEFERIREFVRGPYLIPGYMYANQIHMVKNLQAEREGLLSEMTWINKNTAKAPSHLEGQALFDTNCGVCHTIGGINDITKRIEGRTLEGVNALISITDSMVPFMTPFSGTERERLMLAEYLYYLANEDVRPRPQMLVKEGK